MDSCSGAHPEPTAPKRGLRLLQPVVRLRRGPLECAWLTTRRERAAPSSLASLHSVPCRTTPRASVRKATRQGTVCPASVRGAGEPWIVGPEAAAHPTCFSSFVRQSPPTLPPASAHSPRPVPLPSSAAPDAPDFRDGLRPTPMNLRFGRLGLHGVPIPYAGFRPKCRGDAATATRPVECTGADRRRAKAGQEVGARREHRRPSYSRAGAAHPGAASPP